VHVPGRRRRDSTDDDSGDDDAQEAKGTGARGQQARCVAAMRCGRDETAVACYASDMMTCPEVHGGGCPWIVFPKMKQRADARRATQLTRDVRP
jgi:hypothetical protein